MRIDTSPARMERDLRKKDTLTLERLRKAGIQHNRTGTITHRLVLNELKRRENAGKDIPWAEGN